ncbi:MAG: glycoside hydrolase family 44 protein, partial [Opitutaceae bacterium]
MHLNSHPMTLVALLCCASAFSLSAQNPKAILTVDAAADRQVIHPEIYGVMFGLEADLKANNTTLNRHGGNYGTRYNWQLNASNHARPCYLSRVEPGGNQPCGLLDAVMENSRAAGASTMITIPISGWVAKLGPGGSPLWSYSIAKYGAQTQHSDVYPDAGNGFRVPDGAPVTDNDPNDANQRVPPEFQRGLVEHLVKRWGRAADGGARYYLMDNESTLWWANHGDVIRTGPSAAEIRDDIATYATMIRQIDPTALIGAPDEWGWNSFFFSGLDQQWGSDQKKLTGSFPG